MNRRNRRDPHRDTDPQSISFACNNGYSANPMYLKCDICPNHDTCSKRISLRIDEILRGNRGYDLAPPYNPRNPPEELQFNKYFGWISDRFGNYDMTGTCVFGEPPRDPRGHLYCQQSCPILRSREIYCLVAAKEMNARDTDRRCREKMAKKLDGWEKVFKDPETGYYSDLESNRPKSSAEQWREIKIGMAVWAVICFIAWLLS